MYHRISTICERAIGMDYSLIQSADKNLIYYGIYNTEVEIQDGSDVLCTVRKNYFESGRFQKNRTSLNIAGVVYKSAYVMEDGKPLKWKKLADSRLAERAVPSDDGYYVETLDEEKRPFKKSWYDRHHRWISTEYYSLSDSRNPIWTLFPSTDGDMPVIIRKSGSGATDVLYPFEHVLDRELTEKLNIITFEPQIYCRTSSGGFYYCTADESKTRAAAMKKLIERDGIASEEEERAEQVEPAFTIGDKSRIDIFADTSDEKHDISEMIEEDEPEKTTTQSAGTPAGEIILQPETETEKAADPAPEKPEPSDAAHIEEEKKPEPSDDTEAEIGDIKIENDTAAQSAGELCTSGGDCPFERTDRLIIESGGVSYYYFGETDGDKRSGCGRTVMSDGRTAYEGSYAADKRDGFGVYYYRSGKICYVGSWQQNKRSGLGAAFSSSDGSLYVGKWENNATTGAGASFSSDGELLYAGCTEDGIRQGAGMTRTADGGFFVGKYKDGEFQREGTLFDKDGNMLYSGGYYAGKRNGFGNSYRPDGSVIYRGEWKNDKCHGNGTLYLVDGGTLSGQFRAGAAHGKCTLTDSEGRVIYSGSFANDTYNGTGRLYREDGGYAEGRFVDGEPTGVFNEYDSEKHLIYCGEWNDMRRSGKGIEYRDGEKVYEGSFENSLYEGEGKLYENGRLKYAGSFSGGIINGFGIEFTGDDIRYQGMWKNARYDGCGILYHDGLPKYAGCFKDGKREGRINEISNRTVIRKSIYENNELVYMCEFTHGGELKYYGCVSGGRRSGMGCSFGASCEKEFEGIFKNGEPEKPMQVFYRELAELPQCSELESTEYELFRKAPDYIIEKRIGAGIFTGRLRDGVPSGRGTMLYFDHRYTGMFSEGKARGEGVIYTRDGTEIRGVFGDMAAPDCKTCAFGDVTYYLVAEG